VIPWQIKPLSRKHFVRKANFNGGFIIMINFSLQEFAAVLFSFSEFLDVFVLILGSIHGGIPTDGFSWTKALKAFIQKGKFCFFLCDFSELYNWVEIEALQISPANIFIGLGYAMTSFVFLLSYNFMLAFNLTAVLTLWLIVNDFYKKIQLCLEASLHPPEPSDGPKEHKLAYTVHNKCASDNEKLFNGLLESYNEVKKLAGKINEALGEPFLCTTFVTCYFFAINLSAIYAEQRWAAKIIVYHFLIKTVVFFNLPGDICHKVRGNCN